MLTLLLFTLIGTFVLCLFLDVLIAYAYGDVPLTYSFAEAQLAKIRKQKTTPIDTSRDFPPMYPTSNAREDVKAYNRQIQAYLMERWEQRMEEETGALEYRVLFEHANAYLSALRYKKEAAYSQHRNEFTRYDVDSRRTERVEINNEIMRQRRTSDEAEAKWRESMILPYPQALHTYHYTPLWRTDGTITAV